jgi:hypothetical protein
VLETNAALNSIKARPEDKALQVILDALPADNNALALGSSLQKNLLVLPGVTIESLAIQSVGGSDDTETSDTTIPFTMTVSATDANTLKDMLARLERSIRVIDIDTLTLERTEGKYTMTVSAHAYYEPAVTVQLKDEVVKSK